MADKGKSVLDGIPVDDKAFPLNKSRQGYLDIVGQCPKCGSPIYGEKYISDGQQPSVKYSCDCRSGTRKDIQDTMQIK